MNWILPIVVGTTAWVYIHSFNRIMHLYEKSERTLDLQSFYDSYIPR